MKLSVYILAHNEQDKIGECIKTVLWADEIIVADSFSTDKTADIAKSYGAKVINIDFKGFGDLRNQAIANCSGEWILSIDSDERCTVEVMEEIIRVIDKDTHDIYRIPRKNYFMGKWIHFSGWYPNFRQPQLFKKGYMIYDNKPVHEGFISKSAKKIGVLENFIWQFPFKDTTELIHKANKYSSLGVSKLAKRNKRGSVLLAFMHGLWSFTKHYILKLGFLDGGPGFVIAFGNFEGTFYRYIKLYESQSDWEAPRAIEIKKKSS